MSRRRIPENECDIEMKFPFSPRTLPSKPSQAGSRRGIGRLTGKRALAAGPPTMTGYSTYHLRPPAVTTRKFMLAVGIFTFFYSALFTLMPRFMSIIMLVPVGVLWLMVIWALPVGRYRPGRVLSALFLGYSFSLLMIPSYIGINIPGLPWITTVRLFGGPAILLLLVYGSTSQPFREQMLAMLRSEKAITGCIVAFAIIQLLSILMSDYPAMTFEKVVNNQIAWTGMFFIALWHFRRIESLRRWVWMYLVCMFLLAILAIVESRYQRILWANSIPDLLLIKDEVVEAILAGSTRFYGGYRVTGTSTTPLSFAELHALTIPFALYLMDKLRTLKGIVAGLLMIALSTTTIFLTDARLGIVSSLAGLLVYGFYFFYHRWRFTRTSLIAPAGVAFYPVAAAVFVAASILIGRIRIYVWGHSGQAESTDARFEQARMAMGKIIESPLIGFGASRGGPKVGWVSPSGKLSIDSYYVSILMDYGILGFVAFYGLFIIAIGKAFQIAFARNDDLGKLAAAWGTYLLIFLTSKAVLSQELNHPLIFIGFAAVVALSAHARADAPAPVRTGRRQGPLPFALSADPRRS